MGKINEQLAMNNEQLAVSRQLSVNRFRSQKSEFRQNVWKFCGISNVPALNYQINHV